jgi:hypothetical protein
MSVKGKLSRSSLEQMMPVHAESLGFTNASSMAVNQVTFSYRTNTEAAAALLPTEVEIDENPKISMMFLSYGFSSVGPFREYVHNYSRASMARKSGLFRISSSRTSAVCSPDGKEKAIFPPTRHCISVLTGTVPLHKILDCLLTRDSDERRSNATTPTRLSSGQ